MLDERPLDVLLVPLVPLDVLLVLLVLLDVLPLLPHQLAVQAVVVKNTLSGPCLHSGDSVTDEIGKDQFLAWFEFFRRSAVLVRNDCSQSVEHLSYSREQMGSRPGQDAELDRSYCQHHEKHFLDDAV